MRDNSCITGGAYTEILAEARSAGNITYSEFDELVLKKVSLFDVPDDDYLFIIEQTLDKIISALPAFKRIFAKPIIRLTDAREIVPIEAVKLIDNHSLMHVAARSELWDDVTERGIKPRKLMTTEPVETYSIYENIAFVYAVDTILAFIKQTATIFKDIMYGSKDLHFNLLDRTHHSLYFVAIGKLHLEYSRARAEQSDWTRCIDKLLFVDKTLRAKLRSPVYLKCKKTRTHLDLKKTNIFRSHKDYATVYNILKWFENDMENVTIKSIGISSNSKEYGAFCSFLSVFAAGHFNFAFPSNARFDLCSLDTECHFKDWTLKLKKISTGLCDGILFTVAKDREFSSFISFCEKSSLSPVALERLREEVRADEYLFCSANSYGEKDVLYLNVYDVDSFRRIQQLLLRSMIWSDEKRDVCPFCGHPLEATEDGHECQVCRGQLLERICPETNKKYYISKIKQVRALAQTEKENYEKRRFLHDRQDEAQLHFRNISPISSDGTPSCPHCGKYHF